jgi:hypothetical protein
VSDIKIYESMARLRSNSDFAAVIKWIEQLRDKCKEDLTTSPEGVTKQLQGKAQAFGVILTAEKDATEVLRKAKS